MTDDRLSLLSLSDAFTALLELPQDARQPWVDAHVRHPNDRATLERMLRADVDTTPGFLDESVIRHAVALDVLEEPPTLPEQLIGRRIGAFRLQRLLGQGGMATVFLATRLDVDFEQHVAIKLLRRGLYSSVEQKLFQRERRVLSRLHHPHVARLIDGGVTEAGIPYLVMEYVDGVRLDAYVSTHRLDLSTRLRLFSLVCAAVESAHQALIVHRDLKPSNILVAADGTPKLLDFGIAKMLADDESDSSCRTATAALTPDYAAPEQLSGASVTTATDVYALGVVLHELVTGLRPDRDQPLLASQRVRSTSRLSDPTLALPRIELTRALRGDLDNIIARALQPEPKHRYASAFALAEDIDNHLHGRPVLAHPPSRRYRLQKFVVRHPRSVVATGVLAIALVATSLTAMWQAGKAHDEAALARSELERANAMRDFMFEVFGEAEPNAPRTGPATVIDAVEHAIATAQQNRQVNPRVRIELLTRLATILEAQGQLRPASELFEEIAHDAVNVLGPLDPLMVEIHRLKSRNAILRGELESARRDLDPLLVMKRDALDDTHIKVLLDSAMLATKEHDLIRAQREDAEAITLARGTGNTDLLVSALGAHGNVLLTLDKIPESIATYGERLAIVSLAHGGEHRLVAAAEADLSRALRRNGDIAQAEALIRHALDIDRKIYTADDWHLANHLNALSMTLREKRDFHGALEAEQDALRIRRTTLSPDHPDIATDLNNIGALHCLLDDFASAVPPLREALALTAAKFGSEHGETAILRMNYGYAVAKSGSYPEGMGELEHALSSIMSQLPRDQDLLATILEKQARIDLDVGNAQAALTRVGRLGAALAKTASDPYWDGRAETLKGRALLDLGRLGEAELALRRGERLLDNSRRADAVLVAENTLLRALIAARSDTSPQALVIAAEARRCLATVNHPPKDLLNLASALPR